MELEPKAFLLAVNVEQLCVTAKDLIDTEISNQKQVNVQRLMQDMAQNDFN
jgi:hypothetical protein